MILVKQHDAFFEDCLDYFKSFAIGLELLDLAGLAELHFCECDEACKYVLIRFVLLLV